MIELCSTRSVRFMAGPIARREPCAGSSGSFRRWRDRYDGEGLSGLFDRRLGNASAGWAPVDEVGPGTVRPDLHAGRCQLGNHFGLPSQGGGHREQLCRSSRVGLGQRFALRPLQRPGAPLLPHALGRRQGRQDQVEPGLPSPVPRDQAPGQLQRPGHPHRGAQRGRVNRFDAAAVKEYINQAWMMSDHMLDLSIKTSPPPGRR